MRRATFAGSVGGRPSLTPWERLTANASRMRSPIFSRSICAKVIVTWAKARPVGVVMSTSASSATSPHPFRCARSMIPAKSSIERESLSHLATSLGSTHLAAGRIGARRWEHIGNT
jgi:hypothetical protein